jgi:hypothetical protein
MALLRWLANRAQRDSAEDAKYDLDQMPLPHGTEADFLRAKSMYALMKSLDWQYLPNSGGLLEQDELLMHNILLINDWEHTFRAQDEANKALGESGLIESMSDGN